MISFEREIRNYLKQHNIDYEDFCDSFSEPDFKVIGNTTDVWMEVKEKRQKYSADKWPLMDIPETSAFILDELTARKLFNFGSTAVLFVRDNTTGLYYFSDPLALFLMPRVRAERNHNGFMKGKWVLDLRNFYGSERLHDLFVFTRDWLQDYPGLVGRNAAIYRNDFVGENRITEAGTPRTEQQKEHDVEATR